MRKGNLFIILGLALGLGVGAFAGLKAGQEVKEAKAYTNRTVYCAIYGTWLGSNSLKVNTNVGDNNTWVQEDMVNTGKTYENMMIFRGVFEERYGGVDALQFQIYDGSTWKWQREPISSWTTSGNYSDKIYLIDEEGVNNWVDYQETTVNFVDENDVVGGELEYNASNNQYEGVYTTTKDNEKFRLKKVTGETTTYPNALTDEFDANIAESDGTWITIKTASAYMVYLKDDGRIWIQDAEPYLVAYAYAGYFLTHIGCDPLGLAVPSGWSTLATRYDSLDDDVKDYIYSFNIASVEEGDNIAKMIKTYNWAISHNPNTLSRFIVNSSDAPRSVPAASSFVTYDSSLTNSTNNVLIIIAIIAGASLLSIGGYLVLRNRKED